MRKTQPKDTKMKKVVGYIRTSTTRQGVSIRKQKDSIKEYCRKNELEKHFWEFRVKCLRVRAKFFGV